MAQQYIGRYELIHPIASGGMATVYLGRVVGAGGFQRVVAVKVMHPHIASDPDFVDMFLDEARLAAGIRHPNVVATIDIEQGSHGLSIVMEYVEGAAANVLVKSLLKQGQRLPLAATLRIVLDALSGLHAAHELRGADGQPLGLVHRDVSPQNILVGVDGVSRITDFGVARAEARISSTRGSQVKGKVPYMSPEQLRAETLDRRTDVYAIGVVLWEMLTGARLFRAPSDGALVASVMAGPTRSPVDVDATIPQALSDVTMRALGPVTERYASAADFADALEEAAERAGMHPSSPRALGNFVRQSLEAAGLQPLPETLGGAGALPTDYKSSPHHSATPLPSSPSGISGSNPAVLPPAPLEEEEAPTIARDVTSGISSLVGVPVPVASTGSASIVQPVASPPRRRNAVGLGAMIGGGIFMVALAAALTWMTVLRKDAPASAGTPAPDAVEVVSVPTPSQPSEPAVSADPTPIASMAPSADVAPTTEPSAAPAKTTRPTEPSPTPARPAPAPKPKGSEFQPDRL